MCLADEVALLISSRGPTVRRAGDMRQRAWLGLLWPFICPEHSLGLNSAISADFCLFLPVVCLVSGMWLCLVLRRVTRRSETRFVLLLDWLMHVHAYSLSMCMCVRVCLSVCLCPVPCLSVYVIISLPVSVSLHKCQSV